MLGFVFGEALVTFVTYKILFYKLTCRVKLAGGAPTKRGATREKVISLL